MLHSVMDPFDGCFFSSVRHILVLLVVNGTSMYISCKKLCFYWGFLWGHFYISLMYFGLIGICGRCRFYNKLGHEKDDK